MLRSLLVKVCAKVVVRLLKRAFQYRETAPQQPALSSETESRSPVEPVGESTTPEPSASSPENESSETTPQHYEGELEEPDDVTILVADDEDAVREILEVRLEREQFTVLTAADGNEARRRIRSEDPDLVFLDWLMPYKNGLRVLREVRTEGKRTDLPIFMMLDRGNSADKVKALSEGANDCIEKPINFDVALARIGTQLDLVGQYKRIQSLVQYDEETRLFNRSFLLERLDVELERVERHGGELLVMVVGVESDGGTRPEGIFAPIAENLDETLRQMDVLGRYDQDHFGVILPETSEEHRSVVVERILETLARDSFTEKFTFRFGTSMTTTGEITPQNLFTDAFDNLGFHDEGRDQQAG